MENADRKTAKFSFFDNCAYPFHLDLYSSSEHNKIFITGCMKMRSLSITNPTLVGIVIPNLKLA